jgi:Cation transporting ATPase, C-terminus
MAFSLIGQLVVLYFPPLQKVFRTVGLSFSDLIFVITLSSSMLVLDTIRKKYFSSVFTEVLSNDSFRSDKGKKVVDKNGSFMV